MMKKTYIAPSAQVVELTKEMPVLCQSGGTTPTANDAQPEEDDYNNNLFSVGKEGWNAWTTSDDEIQD